MDELKIIHKGIYLAEHPTMKKGSHASLIMQDYGIELVMFDLNKGITGVVYPIGEESKTEVYYIIKGELEVCTYNKRDVLSAGDIFYITDNKATADFFSLTEVKMLCFNNSPSFQTLSEREQALTDALEKLQKADGDTKEHCNRVRLLSIGIARTMKYNSEKIMDLFYAAIFHDIGKCHIPLEILIKPAKLTNEEYLIIKKHPQFSDDMVRGPFGDKIADIILQHHERLDGTGYPNGLKAEQISLPAKIIAVADAFDAMTTTRPYHTGCSEQEALTELRRCAGTQFDEAIVEALATYLDKLKISIN